MTSLVSKSVPDDIAAKYAEASAARLIVDLKDEKKRVVARMVARSIREGWDKATLAAKIAEKVGLDQRSANAVETYRLGLLKRGTPKGIARNLSRDYARRLRAHRASVIAETEVRAAVAGAQRELWARQQKAGQIKSTAVRVSRVTHRDDRLCDVCRRNDGKKRPLGSLLKQGPPYHPSCRCIETLEDGGVVIDTPTRSAP